MSRKGGSGLGGGLLFKGLVDTPYFEDFIHANIKNPDFKKWGASKDVSHEDIEQLWREVRTQNELKNVHETSIEEAISTVTDSVSGSVLSGWFKNADSSYKPRLMDEVLSNPGTLNAGLNIAYHNYKFAQSVEGKTPLSFGKWLKTPQTVYRGSVGKSLISSDIFTSFTPDKKIAQGFAGKNGSISTIKIRPIDTWGSYQTTGEQEFLIPVKVKK